MSMPTGSRDVVIMAGATVTIDAMGCQQERGPKPRRIEHGAENFSRRRIALNKR